jgi:hypothetical protein
MSVPADTYDLDGNGDTDEPIPLDLNGSQRFVDDPDTEDTGMGDPPVIDMGGFEYRQFALMTGDYDHDGDIDVLDYSAQFACFHGPGIPVTPSCTSFDFNFDSDVDLIDWAGFQAAFTGESE